MEVLWFWPGFSYRRTLADARQMSRRHTLRSQRGAAGRSGRREYCARIPESVELEDKEDGRSRDPEHDPRSWRITRTLDATPAFSFGMETIISMVLGPWYTDRQMPAMARARITSQILTVA